MARPKKYPDELVARGVRLALESGRPIAHVAADLGMHPETLRKKVRQAQADSGERPDLPSTWFWLTLARRQALLGLAQKPHRRARAQRLRRGSRQLGPGGARGPQAAADVQVVDGRERVVDRRGLALEHGLQMAVVLCSAILPARMMSAWTSVLVRAAGCPLGVKSSDVV